MGSRTHAAWLFGLAALWNLGNAIAMPVLRTTDSPVQLEPVRGTNVLYLAVASAAVLAFAFAYAYARVAMDHVRFRVYIEFGIVAKLLVVLAIVLTWAEGFVTARVLGLGAGDLIFAGLFAHFLAVSRDASAFPRERHG